MRRARSGPDGRRRRWFCRSAHRARLGPDPGCHHRRTGRRRATLPAGDGAHPQAGPEAPGRAGAAVPDALGVSAPHPGCLQPHAPDAVHGAYTQVVAETYPLDAPAADPAAADSPAARLAVLVPTLNDDAALARLLPLLGRLARAPEQVIVVDGAASEATAELCRGAGCTWMPSPPGRGLQLSAGIAAARAARADVLWMVHADCEPHPLSAHAIREATAAGAAGGPFGVRFGGARRAPERLLAGWIAWRCRLSMWYGGQGTFLTRAASATT